MAIVKATYTRKGGTAKASVRYIEHRSGKDGAKVQRTLFTADGKVAQSDVYAMIDQAAKNSYFFRFVISPDPKTEDSDKTLLLRELADKTIAALDDRFQRPLRWVATIHDDHTDHRHIHAIAIVPGRLQVQDFQRMRAAATKEALEQLRQLDLQREAHQRSQEQGRGLELGL
jgi:hypothetical protein